MKDHIDYPTVLKELNRLSEFVNSNQDQLQAFLIQAKIMGFSNQQIIDTYLYLAGFLMAEEGYNEETHTCLTAIYLGYQTRKTIAEETLAFARLPVAGSA
jgi:valyl-tRNA synthetase